MKLVLLLITCSFLVGCAAEAPAPRSAWQTVPVGTDAAFEDVWFADTLRGWAVGGAYDIEGGLIARTQDGGHTWKFASGFVSKWPGVSSFSFTGVQF